MHGESTVLSTSLCVSLYFFLSPVVATIILIIAGSVYTYQAKNDASELYKLGMGFDFNFADSWGVNSKMLRKIHKDSGHENTFMLEASLAF